MILAVQLAATALVLYGGCLSLWHRATEPLNDERPARSPRNLRLIHELGEAANQPLKKVA